MTSKTKRNRGPSRRGFLAGTAATGASFAFAASASSVHAQAGPVRVGVLNTFTGINASTADGCMKGMNMYFDSIGWTAAGRKVELMQEDDQFNPQIGLQKLRKLVESDRVDLICGPQASNVAMSVRNFIKELRTLTLAWAGVDALMWERLPFLYRTGLTTWQLTTPATEWVSTNVGKEIYLIGADFAAGRDIMRIFKDHFIPKGGKILGETYPPLGTSDYSPYLTNIRSIAPPAVFAFFTGTDAVRFVQQYSQLGLTPKIRLTGFGPLTDGSTLGAQGDTALGIVTPQIYVDTLENAENKAFVAAYRSRYNAYPDIYSLYGYDTARIIDGALKATNGNSDKERLSAAVATVAFASARGPFRFDPETHNVIQNVYMTEIAKVEGRLVQKVISTIENVRDPTVKPG